MTKPENAQAAGLCSTCNNSPTCFYRARRGPALFCELFDDYVAVSPDGHEGRLSRAGNPSSTLRAADEDTSKYTGLCMNCEHRRTCAHPKPAGGIWHCEDYE